MGIALYLRSIFPAEAEPHEAPPPPPKSGRPGGPVSAPAEPQAEEAQEGTGKKAPSPDEEPSQAATPSGDGPVRPTPGAQALAAQAGSPQQAGAGQPQPAGADAPVFEMAAANDNGGGAPAPAHGSYGGSGGSGADGASDDDGEPSDEDKGEAGPNRAPRVAGTVTLREVSGTAMLAIGLTHLLQNAADPDGDPLFVRNLSASAGTLTPIPGGWIFQASPGWLGPVTLTYEITDGKLAIAQTAHFSVLAPAPQGAGENALLSAWAAEDDDGDVTADKIVGSGAVTPAEGASALLGGDGDDKILGTDGADVIFAGGGHDEVSGGDGDDKLFGQGGNDILNGDAGDDALSGGTGDDRLSGGTGSDRIAGDEGHDVIEGGQGDDHLAGNAGNDVIAGDEGHDVIEGGAGDDVIADGSGADTVDAGDGDDQVVAAATAEDDVYAGGAGSDMIDYSAARSDLTLDLVSGSVTGLEIGTDTISGFETVKGGSGDDHFIIGGEALVLVGGAGENTFEFTGEGSGAPSYSVVHEILDFKVGDLIRMSKYDIFEEVLAEVGDRLEEIYGGEVDGDAAAIRYRHERTDEMDWTLIEADLDRDSVFETTIEIEGRHALIVVEHA
jgi:Ca2+-binding RTX toxin-like protein